MLRMLYETLFSTLLVSFFEIIVIKTSPVFTDGVIVFTMFIFSYIVRNISKRNIYNFIFHVIFGVSICAMMYDTEQLWLYMALLVYLFLASLEYVGRGRKLKPLDDMPWPTFLMNFICYLFGWYTKNELLMGLAVAVTICLLIIYYIMTYLEGLKIYVESTKDVQGLPLNKVVARNNVIVLTIIAILIVGIYVGLNVDFSTIANVIKNVFMSVLKLVGSLFMLFFLFLESMVKTGEFSGAVGDGNSAKETNEYIDKAVDSLEIILYAGVFLVSVFFAWKLIKFIIKKLLAKTGHQEDIVEVAESVKDNNVTGKKHKFFKGKLTAEDKARKYYKQAIERYKYSIRLSNTKTCRDIQKDIQGEGLGDVSELTQVYADIRYGQVIPDKKMLKKMSILSK